LVPVANSQAPEPQQKRTQQQRAFFEQTMLTPDALDGDVADKQIARAFHARVTGNRHLSMQSRDLLLDRGAGRLPRAMRSATALSQAGKTLLLVTSPPLVEGESPDTEKSSGGFDAPFSERLDRLQAAIEPRFYIFSLTLSTVCEYTSRV
jgi:hypothetical protein